MKELSSLETFFVEMYNDILNKLPVILIAIAVFLIGLFFINKLKSIVETILLKKMSNILTASFIVNILSLVLTVFLILITLNILGYKTITNKILAAAGISTFIIGFALKDIGENFLAGILMAFRRPFRIGDLIEVDGFKGKVIKMSLRETTIKTADGRDVFIPNAIIQKNSLQNYTIDDLLRTDFTIELDYNNNVEKVIDNVTNTLNTFNTILKSPKPSVALISITNSLLTFSVSYWFNTDDVNAPGASLRNNVLQKVFNNLKENNFTFPISSYDVSIKNNNIN